MSCDDLPSSSDMKPMTNAFRILADDWLNEQKPNEKAVSGAKVLASNVEKALRSLKSLGKAKSSDKPIEYTDIESWTTSRTGVSFPLMHIKPSIENTASYNPNFKWIPPKQVTVVEDNASQILTRDSATHNIYVQIPDELVGKRDFVNVVWPTKRAHYLCSCAVATKKAVPGLKLEFETGSQTDFIFPALLVSNKESSVRINVYASEEALAKTSRFGPELGNLRPSTVCASYEGKDDPATPMYNQRILRCQRENCLRQLIGEELKGKVVLQESLVLLNAWFRSRDYKMVDDLLLCSVMVHLQREGVVAEKQDILTVLRGFFGFLASWEVSTVYGLQTDIDVPRSEEFRKSFDVIFLDDSGYWNLASGIDNDILKRMKLELSTCLKSLGDCDLFFDHFASKHGFNTAFDHYFRLSLSVEEMLSMEKRLAVDCVDHMDRKKALAKLFLSMLREAMGERFEYAEVFDLDDASFKWSVSSPHKHSENPIRLLLGLRTTKQWDNALTVGPVANLPEAKVFRAFWGEMSQLRKFADTRVCECVVWSPTASASVPLKIIKWIVKTKLAWPETSVSWRSGLPMEMKAEKWAQDRINGAFASLSTTLRSLKGLPLMITNIHGVSPYLRGTEPNAHHCVAADGGVSSGDHQLPQEEDLPPYTASVTVHLKLEYSGKWGNDYDAIRNLTAAFYIQIAELLKKSHRIFALPTMDQLFIVKDDIVFKMIIVHDKVIRMLEHRLEDLRSQGVKVHQTLDGKRLDMYRMKYVTENLLQLSLHAFSTKFAVFAETVQVMKRWLGGQMLSGAFPDLALELLVAAAVDQRTVPTPQTTMCALRRVLRLLSEHDWTSRPLIVDLGHNWNDEERCELEANFVKMRPVLPPMVIVTNEDKSGAKWTRDNPSPMLLKRMVALAAASLKVLDAALESPTKIDLKTAFLPEDCSKYDHVIHLRPEAVNKRLERINTINAQSLPVVDVDMVEELIHTLNTHYHTVAIFFYNKYGGLKIGVKFRPQEEEVPAKISRCALHSSFEGNRLLLNRKEVIEGISILGDGIVDKIE